MKTASISEAKNRLSAYIDLVRKGETVLITDRNTPVAQLVPLQRAANADDEAWLQALERKGLIKRASKRAPSALLQTPPPKLPPGVSLLDALLEERHSGR
jgi:prevent-host-death family protein